MEARTTFEGDKRLYLTPADGELAPFGARAPVAATVLLDRKAGVVPTVEEVDNDRAAGALAQHLFAPNRPPAACEELAAGLARRVPAFRLRYDDPDAAVSVLGATLAS